MRTSNHSGLKMLKIYFFYKCLKVKKSGETNLESHSDSGSVHLGPLHFLGFWSLSSRSHLELIASSLQKDANMEEPLLSIG